MHYNYNYTITKEESDKPSALTILSFRFQSQVLVMEFSRSPEMEEVQSVYGSSHGYEMKKALAVPDVSAC